MATTPRRRNVAKLLARLNPKGMALQPSSGNTRGGAPEETALDIAAALGYVSQKGPGPGLAVIVLCLRWWPGMVEGPMQVVGYHEIRQTDTVRGQKRVRVEKLSIEAPAETRAFRVVADTLAARLERRTRPVLDRHYWLATQARMDGGDGDKDVERDLNAIEKARSNPGAWARAVIHEYRHPNHCPTCTPWGRAGEVPRPVEEGGKIIRVEWRTCDNCHGGGTLAWSSKRRAKALRIGEHPWRNHLNPIHDGALALLRELEWRAAVLLVRRLGA